MAKVSEIIEKLQKRDPDEEICMILWQADDVKYTAEDRDITLSDEQIDNILSNMQENHDAVEGVNWTIIEYWIYSEVGQ